MLLKYIDYLSPRISLFYNGYKSHTSSIGAILTIIMAISSGVYVFYLIYNIVEHNVSNFMFYKNYLSDAGLYFFNDTGGIFHYFQLYDYQNQVYGQYNSKYVRFFMSRVNYKDYQEESLLNNEHWVYDKCRDDLDNKNLPKEIFTENAAFNKGVCIRYYYDNKRGKYFPIEDKENFKYPYLIHGSGNRDNLLLETVVEKCDNKSITTNILGPCGDENEIKNYLNIHKAIFFQLLEKQVNTENYSKSIYEYIFSITGSLDNLNVPVNNVNFIPFFIELKKGIVLPNKEKIITYLFDDNRKATFNNNINRNHLAIFDYWLVNSCQVIKGGYNNLYDILPNIGGIIQLIYYIFYSLNYLHNRYIVIQDCNKLFFRIYCKDFDEKEEIINKKHFTNYVNSIRDEIKIKRSKSQLKRKSKIMDKKDFIFEYKENNNKLKESKIVKTDINSNKNIFKYVKKDKNELISNSNILSNSNDLILEIQKKNDIPFTTNIDAIRNKKNIIFKKHRFNKNESNTKIIEEFKLNKNKKMDFLYYQFAYQLQEYIYHKNNELKYEPLNLHIVSRFINFFNYFLSLIGNKKKNRVFFIFNKFREKILGEENLFRTKIYLYHLERYFYLREIDKIDILELYDN